jgi:hypothetical protein
MPAHLGQLGVVYSIAARAACSGTATTVKASGSDRRATPGPAKVGNGWNFKQVFSA